VTKDNGYKAWLRPAPPLRSSGKKALVIGAGLAGAASARALAERNWNVIVTERYPHPAGGASGNPQAMLYARLSPFHSPLSRLLLEGYVYSINRLSRMKTDLYQPCGLIQLPVKDGELRYQQQLLACGQFQAILAARTRSELSRLSGIAINRDGIWFPQAGWINPKALVAELLDHPGIQLRERTLVTDLRRTQDGWIAGTPQGEMAAAQVVVVACGHHSCQLQQTAHLPLRSIGGQISMIPATKASSALQTVLCGRGYVAPAVDGQHTLGASFRLRDDWPGCRPQDHRDNLHNLMETAPGLARALELDKLKSHWLTGRTSFRCTTPDYLPVVGPVMDVLRFRDSFSLLAKNARSVIDSQVPWLEGLYINTGHGSRGLTTCLLASDILASQISGEPGPVHEDISAALHPGRFPARALIRQSHPVRQKHPEAAPDRVEL